MVQVVDDADVLDASFLQTLDDGDLILGLAEPAAMIVQTNLQTAGRSGCGESFDPQSFAFNARRLLIRVFDR